MKICPLMRPRIPPGAERGKRSGRATALPGVLPPPGCLARYDLARLLSAAAPPRRSDEAVAGQLAVIGYLSGAEKGDKKTGAPLPTWVAPLPRSGGSLFLAPHRQAPLYP